ncbi:TKL/TKL-ccin protein kinase [Lyophyllum atratum]|nr:TKL/TKL-ccin protein kinase [Lyophyllum atratum]
MNALVSVGVTGLELVGAVGGVPFAGAAAIAVREIALCCHEVRVHKVTPSTLPILSQSTPDARSSLCHQRKARHMANRCAELLNTLEEQSSALVGTALQTRADEVAAAAIITNSNNVEAHETQQRDAAEIIDLLHQVLANQGGELRQVRQMQLQNADDHVAETIMLEGQKELQILRESENAPERDNHTIPDIRSDVQSNVPSTSPPPVPKDSQRYLDYQRGVIQRGLIQLHQLTGIPPTVKRLNGEVVKIGDLAIAGGTYSDIWQGIWLGEKKVALKALRNIKATDPKAQKVSPWQDNGNVLEYVKKTPDANRIFCPGAAQGLDYLHSRNITHGNVKCANILVSSKGEACICDFGMSKVIEEVTERSASATLTASGSARWLAPELIEGVVTSPTKEADTYSYAMAILELLTGKHPFSNRRRDASVIHDIVVLKQIPQRPTEAEVVPWLSDSLWALMTECWKVPASSRPSMHQVSACIQDIEEHADANAMDVS